MSQSQFNILRKVKVNLEIILNFDIQNNQIYQTQMFLLQIIQVKIITIICYYYMSYNNSYELL